MKNKFCVLTICLFLSGLVSAQTAEQQAAETETTMPPLVIGIIKNYSGISATIDSSCYLSDRKYLNEGTRLVVSGFERCTPRYGSPENFYEVMRAGEKYYIKEDDLFVGEYGPVVQQMQDEVKEEFAKRARRISISMRKDQLQSLLDAVKSHKKSGLTVASSKIYDESEYTEGTSFAVEVINPTNKVIKYVWFTIVGYNAVGDPVVDRMRGTSSITVRGIGPIAPDASGEYSWKYLWHTDLVETFKLSRIKVQYMDGSVRQIDNVKSITLNAAQRQTWNETEG